jgi:hypothetical protein
MKAGGKHYFFDIPVYRIKEDQYYLERDAHLERILYPPDASWAEELRELHKREPDTARPHIERSFGQWIYNEIIGYIRLHFLGDQIRVEYFSVTKKRIVRTRTKIFEYQTWKLARELDVPSDASSKHIYALVKQYLSDCGRQVPKRHIDTTMLDAIGPYVDWRRLYADHYRNAYRRELA